MLQQTQKITATLPKELLHNVQAMTGLGITETLKEALEQYARTKVYENLRQCRGKFAACFKDFDLNELRKDKDEE